MSAGNNSNRRPTKNEKRRQRKKEDKDKRSDDPIEVINGGSHNGSHDQSAIDLDDDIVVEYVGANYEEDESIDTQMFDQFKDIFKKFSKPEDLLSDKPRVDDSENVVSNGPQEESKGDIDDGDLNKKPLSKRKKKLMSRLSVAELKQLVNRPDVVEAHDVTSSNPRLLIHLKACRNTVPVPRHWCQIRKYLQGKRGIEKIPFQLPDFIAETGIAKIRDSILEQEALRKGKQKARERVRPKMGKIDIDYQVLHDAFFKFQTKPKLAGHGDLYYEGKEFEVQMKEKKPGVLSPELVSALGMQESAPPPWLINMQRFGPPPSYPNLRIPGLNAPLPPGASYGYQPGGWGKPPVDEYGRPLYGDVFGTALTLDTDLTANIDKNYRWGTHEFVEEEEEEEEDDDEEEEEEEDDRGRGRGQSRDSDSGIETPMSLADQSWISGLETNDNIVDLRKRAGTETPESSVAAPSRELYQVIKETKGTTNGQFFGSDRLYAFPAGGDASSSVKAGSASQASVTQNEALSRHLSRAKDGAETEEDTMKGSKKRKAEESIVSRKAKEFKF